MRNLSSWMVGVLFAMGLGISGMTQPQKVIGFLDVFGRWDPALLFVMVGAVGVYFLGFRIIRLRQRPVLAEQWVVPPKAPVTKKLVVGAFIFGIGWGWAGFCPGPAVTSLASVQPAPLVFVFAMMLGMQIYRWQCRLTRE